jgi:hypothetical protein
MGANDNFRAWGLPLLMLAILAGSVVLNHKQLLRAATTHTEHPQIVWLLRLSAANAVLSIFLMFTAAWGFGLVSALICYIVALYVAKGAVVSQGKNLLTLQLVWFGLLIGVPDFLTGGTDIFVRVSGRLDCLAFYAEAAPTMCAPAWLTIVEIISCVLVGLTFLSLLMIVSLTNLAAANESSSTSGLGAGAIPPPTPKGGHGEYIQSTAAMDYRAP